MNNTVALQLAATTGANALHRAVRPANSGKTEVPAAVVLEHRDSPVLKALAEFFGPSDAVKAKA